MQKVVVFGCKLFFFFDCLVMYTRGFSKGKCAGAVDRVRKRKRHWCSKMTEVVLYDMWRSEYAVMFEGGGCAV